jgi:hypothetical protein
LVGVKNLELKRNKAAGMMRGGFVLLGGITT